MWGALDDDDDSRFFFGLRTREMRREPTRTRATRRRLVPRYLDVARATGGSRLVFHLPIKLVVEKVSKGSELKTFQRVGVGVGLGLGWFGIERKGKERKGNNHRHLLKMRKNDSLIAWTYLCAYWNRSTSSLPFPCYYISCVTFTSNNLHPQSLTVAYKSRSYPC